MSITKFEEGKKYRFLKNSIGGGKLYNGVDAGIGQEFTVHKIDKDGGVYTKDVRFQGLVDTTEGWVVYRNSPETPTTLDDFEEVVETSPTSPKDLKITVHTTDLIGTMVELQKEHNLVLMFHGGEVVISFENSDTEYQISSQEELTTLIEASKVMKRFERKVDYND